MPGSLRTFGTPTWCCLLAFALTRLASWAREVPGHFVQAIKADHWLAFTDLDGGLLCTLELCKAWMAEHINIRLQAVIPPFLASLTEVHWGFVTWSKLSDSVWLGMPYQCLVTPSIATMQAVQVVMTSTLNRVGFFRKTVNIVTVVLLIT